jgi:fumarylacetoacetase
MTLTTDDTHDPALKSWVASANIPGAEFPIQNLPLCVFRPRGTPSHGDVWPHVGVGIGSYILDVSEQVPGGTLNAYMALPRAQRRDLRAEWSRLLRRGGPQKPLHSHVDCELLLPAAVGDYTDFYASIHHATNVGRMFRPDNPLLPNYKHVPIAYHGRSSSLVASGTPVVRPCGQLAEGKFGPTAELDYELEVGLWLGPGNTMGTPVPVANAWDHIAGIGLVNDWSARDIQRWEYQPLGPFLAKNFATSVSPWVVTAEALAPFFVEAPAHDSPPLAYLKESPSRAVLLTLEVWLKPAEGEEVRLSRTSFEHMYWTPGQMVAHHTSNGCPLRAGDLIASGTVSGPEKENRGCLLELTWRGTEPFTLPGGGSRTFLADGDEVILRGGCEREGFARIGLGECRGVVGPAPNH